MQVTTTKALQIISEQKFDAYGIRVINNHFENTAYAIDDILPPSCRWENGDPTDEELYGTSAIEVNESNLDSRLSLLKKVYGCLGSQIVLLGSYQYVYGEDDNEIEMKEAVVLAIL